MGATTKQSSVRFWLAGALLVLGASPAAAAGDAPLQEVGTLGQPGGSGPHPAVAVAVASMRENTLYHPQSLPEAPLPLVIWGTGGCRDNGLGYSGFLKEIASHGYFVISGGHPRYERGRRAPGSELSDADRAALRALDDTSVDQLLAAIDWAADQSADPGGPYHGRIDTGRVAAMGHSCGGLQAIALGGDPRVETVIAFNSGVLSEVPEGFSENANLVVEKSALENLHGAIAYINGGPEDIAYENALDDLDRLEHVPVFFGDNGVGHGGTFWADEHGGEYADVAVAWLDWQLRSDADAAGWFRGDDCRLCVAGGWKIEKKDLD